MVSLHLNSSVIPQKPHTFELYSWPPSPKSSEHKQDDFRSRFWNILRKVCQFQCIITIARSESLRVLMIDSRPCCTFLAIVSYTINFSFFHVIFQEIVCTFSRKTYINAPNVFKRDLSKSPPSYRPTFLQKWCSNICLSSFVRPCAHFLFQIHLSSTNEQRWSFIWLGTILWPRMV